MKVPQSAAPAAEQPHVETPATTPAPAATRAQEPAQPAATPVAADSRAALEIIKTVRKAGLQSEFAESLIEQGMTLDQARAAIIDKIAEAGTATVRSHVTHGAQDDQEMKRSGMESALMHRILPSQALTENGKRFRGMSVVRMAEEYLGERGRGLTPSETVTRSLSSSDFPLILGNVAEKMLMNAYGLLQKTFEPFVTPGTLRDYKPAYRYQVGDAPSLLEIKEGGEYKKGSFGEKAESMSLADYGRKLVFTRQMMINDDLGAFQRVIGNFGSSASRLESQLVYAILTGNPNMADGVALFHANHGNLAGATAITEAGLTAAEILLMNQKSLDNADYLNLVGKFLICGTAKKVEAQKMLASVLSAKSSDVNPFQNAYTLIVDPRVSGTKWFLATDPNALACIELARLEGETGPVVDSKESWDTDGIEVKCRHTVVAKAIEWKGIVYNPGA